MTVLYNPLNGADIKDLWMKDVPEDWNFKKNSIQKFVNDGFAQFLLKTYQFLREIDVKDIIRYQEKIEKDAAKPKDVEEIEKKNIEKLTEEQQKALESLPGLDNASIGPVRSGTIDEQEGILGDQKTDGDGVVWTGGGLEEDIVTKTDMKRRRPGKTRGAFKAS